MQRNQPRALIRIAIRILLREACRDALQLRLRLPERDPWRESPDQAVVVGRSKWRLEEERVQRHPNFSAFRVSDASREHPDHLKRFAPDAERSADDRSRIMGK